MPEGDIQDILTDIYEGFREFTYVDDGKDIQMIVDAECLWQGIEGEIKTPLGAVRGIGTENYGCRIWDLVGEKINNLTVKVAKEFVSELADKYDEVNFFEKVIIVPYDEGYLEVIVVVDSIYGRFTGTTHLKTPSKYSFMDRYQPRGAIS